MPLLGTRATANSTKPPSTFGKNITAYFAKSALAGRSVLNYEPPPTAAPQHPLPSPSLDLEESSPDLEQEYIDRAKAMLDGTGYPSEDSESDADYDDDEMVAHDESADEDDGSESDTDAMQVSVPPHLLSTNRFAPLSRR